MAANSSSNESTSRRANDNQGANSPFTGSLAPAQLATEMGRCLRSQYQALLKEPFPDELADLIRQLQEREEGRDPTA
jgi:hypothetical protein